jgi:hypothetical protein
VQYWADDPTTIYQEETMSLLSKHFKIATIVPSVYAVVAGIVLALTHDGSKYKSEWFTNDGFGEGVFLIIVLSGIIYLLSLTIFLNSFQFVQNSSLLSGLAWLALPGGLSLFVVYQELLNFSGSNDLHGNNLLDGYILSVGLLHLFCLFFSFGLYRLKRTTSEDPGSV